MVEFAGYDMPVQYASVIGEAKAVREGAGMFDVSHMARLRFAGPDVLAYLERVTTNDVAKLADRTGQYSLLPNKKGGLVDDIIVYRIDAGEFRMVVNAANHAKDVAWLRAENSEGLAIEDHTDATAMIAVQGPKAVEILAANCPNAEALRSAPAFGVVEGPIFGIHSFAARSGYTGEDGYEIICGAHEAEALWDALLAAGVAPCGLASRDILRVEAGLPLYGHELEEDLDPLEAGLGWVIGKTKSFNGSTFFADRRANGVPRKLVGIAFDSKRVAEPGAPVLANGETIGIVTSGVYSPLLERGIAFAFVASSVPLETPVEVPIRGKNEPAKVVGKRFFKRTS